MLYPVPRLVAVLFCLLASALSAAVRDHDITLDDYFTQAYITSAVISPDGNWVAYTEMRWEPPAESRNTELWIVRTATGETRRLTFDPGADAGPQWASDSRSIFFSASRGEEKADPPLNHKPQVWRVSIEGGEAQAVTRLKDGIDAFKLSLDGKALYYTTSDDNIGDEWKSLREKFKDVTYGDGVDEISVLYRLDLITWRTEELVNDKRSIREFAVTRDGSRIAMITTPNSKLVTNEGWSRVDIYDGATKAISALEDSLWREQAPSPYGWIEGLAWSPDAKKLALGVGFDGYAAEFFVADWSTGEPRTQKLQRVREFSPADGGSIAWMPNSRDLLVGAEERARVRVAAIRDIANGKQGRTDLLTPGDLVVEQFSLSTDGAQIAANISDVTNPGDIYLWSTTNATAKRKLTHVNPQIDNWKLPRIETVTWTGAHGEDVEGILELPPDYVPGKPLPMFVSVHGGPTDSDKLRFEFWIYGRVLLAARGWAVLCPNYRGSTGYGDRFCADLIGHENEIEVEDILRGVDAMVERGIADSAKLAVGGWSNGGYLTNCLITHTQRFKAASSGAGVVDMSIQWGIEDTPGHVINYMRGLPWSAADEMRKASPLYQLDRVTTPTLIHVGEKDERVPAAHAKTLHRALHQYLGVPTELVIYPGQGHGLSKLTQRRCKLEWDLHWFDKYVLGAKTDDPPKPAQ
ncbi:S9 family peptidase [candidate division KSB1 bacterium]|nr:S9 family peptidase [candidate division KSB1 bacterium]